ncbi:tyrosine-type recombinase/integrase [Sulfurimonas marina]|uniref:DUF4102 domain-containing protein n=1 Tax=Sulfurimonas marina TaxID=2590551 RepID=A0A7M1AWK8_9BACT|nr:integrase arm-type DNA-binding domain-containing protein [Sulfurimonas marina]QOP41805.1 DUF4102 domain-containing protein [Sulfurimonas marina]
MIRAENKLNDKAVKSAKPENATYSISDGKGLTLQVHPNGSKLWRFRYRIDGKQKMLSMGKYPDVSLADARRKTLEARTIVAEGNDPSQVRKDVKHQKKAIKEAIERKTTHSFEFVANEILNSRFERGEITEVHYKRTYRAFENDVYPFIGSLEVAEITPNQIMDIVERVEERGAHDSAYKLFYAISKIYKTIIARRKYDVEFSPTASISIGELIGAKTKKHYPTITDRKGIKGLLLAIESYQGDYSTKMALQVLPHVFLRSSNIRHAEWNEIDFNDRLWRIPASKMKTKEEFLIPLSDQVFTLLKEIHTFTGQEQYVFPSYRYKTAPLSDNTLIGAFRRMGYSKEEFVPHSFRAMFSTIAHEQGTFKHEVIEKQLAHSVGNSVSQAYNRSEYLQDRKELMQWWSDYLEEVKNG